MTAENRLRWAIVGLLALTILSGIMTAAHAQGTCTVGGANTCFVGSKTSGESPLATTLTWNVVGATSCTAGGTGAWNGSIPCSGTRNLSGIMVKMTLTIDPLGPVTLGKMRVSWTPPTQNTDGSLLTNLGGFYIDYGTAAGALNQTINLAVPGANTFDVTGLTAGTWFATVRAATTGCFPTTLVNCFVSQTPPAVSKAVTTTPGGNLPQLTLALDPFQVPKPPTGITVTDPTAMEIRPNSAGTLIASRIGLVPVGTRCYEDERTAAGTTYNGVPLPLVDLINWPASTNLREAWAKCATTVDL